MHGIWYFFGAHAHGLLEKSNGLKQLSFKCSPLGVVGTTTATTTTVAAAAEKSHYNARQQPVEKYYNDVILLHCLLNAQCIFSLFFQLLSLFLPQAELQKRDKRGKEGWVCRKSAA